MKNFPSVPLLNEKVLRKRFPAYSVILLNVKIKRT